MSYTPGKWLIYNTRRGRILGAWRVCGSDGHRPICTMSGKLPPDEEMANARLIDAAPELLEACQAIAASSGLIGNRADVADAMRKVSAAITKATKGE